jgi:predicted ATP-grasp superfamily ATP-dependent carboligase
MKLSEKKSAPAVIVGMESNGLGVARSLRSAGVASIGICYDPWSPCRWTNSCEIFQGTSWTAEGLIADLLRLGQKLGPGAPLLLTKDESVLWVAQARRQLSAYFAIALPDDSMIGRMMDKTLFVETAQRQGWPVPWSLKANSRESLRLQMGEITYPCILKPAVKNNAFRQNSCKKAFKICSADELLRTYEMVAQWEQQVLIQEWIGGGDDRVAFCLGYCRDGKALMTFAGRKLLQWPIECGNTAIAEPIPSRWEARITEITREIWRWSNYQGLGSVEFKMRPETDEAVIMEPTVGRTNYQSEVAVVNGYNIPLAAYCDLSGLPVPIGTPKSGPVKLIDDAAHIKAGRAYRRLGQMSLRKWWYYRKGSKRYMLLRASDPFPFLADLALRAVRNSFQVLLGKDGKTRVAGQLKTAVGTFFHSRKTGGLGATK